MATECPGVIRAGKISPKQKKRAQGHAGGGDLPDAGALHWLYAAQVGAIRAALQWLYSKKFD